MSKFLGRLVRAGLAIESSRGAGGVAGIWIPQVGCTLAAKTEEARVEGALGVLADSEQKLVLEKYGEGELNGEVRDQSIGYILAALMGAAPSSGANGVGYTHTYSETQSNQHASLAITLKDSDLASEMYKMAMLNSLEMSVELGGLVMFNAGFVSLAPIPCSASPSITAENKFSRKHVNLKVATNVTGLDAASNLEIKSLSLTFNKNVERDSVLGTPEPVDILNKQFSIEGNLTLTYEDNTWRNYLTNGDHKALRINIENTDVDLGGGLYPRLRLDLAKVDFTGWEPDRSLNDIVKQTINFKANYDTTYGMIYALTLINAKASY